MNNSKPEIFILTGPCGVGKSTISKIIAEKLDKSALIEGDSIYHLVVGGYVKPWEDDGTYLGLFWENIFDLIDNFLERNISVVLNYIIYPEKIREIIKVLKEKNYAAKFIVLMVDETTIIERDNLREEDCRMGERSIKILNEFEKVYSDSSHILNTSCLSEEKSGEIIMRDDRFYL